MASDILLWINFIQKMSYDPADKGLNKFDIC